MGTPVITTIDPAAPYGKSPELQIAEQISKANNYAEHAYWWLKNVDREDAERLGVAGKVQNVLGLLQNVDNITMDIQITIKQKSK